MREELLPPPYTPIGLGELKAWLRIEGPDEDALLAGLLRAASGACEEWTGLSPTERDVIETVPADGRRKLTRAPVRAITQVVAIDSDGTERVLAADEYLRGIDAEGVATLSSPAADAIQLKVSYRAGVARDWNGVAEPIRHGILIMAGQLYAARDSDDQPGIPARSVALWRSWRRIRLR